MEQAQKLRGRQGRGRAAGRARAPVPVRRPAPRPTPPTPAPSFPGGGLLPESAEAQNWIRRAQEGVEREDWKLAVDALQRLVEMGGGVVTSSDGQVYISARRLAHRMIAELPEAGRRVYRLLHDPEAKTLFDRAVAEHDEALLVQIQSRFLLSSHGDDACDLLAAWWLDEGRAIEAASILSDLLALVPDRDVPDWAVRSKLALAHALSNEAWSAREVLAELDGADGLSDAARARVADVRALVGRLAPAVARGVPESWPMLMGVPARDGRMPAANVSVLSAAPLVQPLPRQAAAESATPAPYRPATGDVVTDGEQFVMRTATRLAAFDVVSLEPIWQSEALVPPVDPRQARTSRQVQIVIRNGRAVQVFTAPKTSSTAPRRASMYGGVTSSVTLAHGLALVVGSTASGGNASRQQGAAVFRRPRVGNPRSPQSQRQLLAFDLRASAAEGVGAGSEGRLTKWAAGGAGRVDDPLTGADFLAPPVAVGPHLLTCFVKNADVFAALLDPVDGRLVKRIHLCGVGTGVPDWSAAQHPAVADHVAYLPTGLGQLAAINLADYSIRWVSRYPRSAATNIGRQAVNRGTIRYTGGQTSGDTWYSGPPVVAGRLVLLAPTDADELFAFDRHTGQIAWKQPRGNHRYILGIARGNGTPSSQPASPPARAARDLVVLGGPRLSGLSIADGAAVWTLLAGGITGRAALIGGTDAEGGDRVFLPAGDTMVIHDALTGNELARAEAAPPDAGAGEASAEPLGNLLTWDASVLSVTESSIRKFPDLVRAYELALAAHARDPGSVVATMRLASLELVRGQPRAAVELLRTIRGAEAVGNRHAERLARVQVRSLLALADEPGTTPAEATSLLDEAFRTARTATDRLGCGLALAALRAETGDRIGAMRQYADMATSSLGRDLLRPPAPASAHQPSTPWAGPWQCRGGQIIARRLPALHAKMTSEDVAAATAELTDRLAKAIAGQDLLTVRAMATTGLLPAVSQRAYLQLARWSLEDPAPQYEEAEHFLRSAVRVSGDGPAGPDPALVAEGLARLAAMHIDGQQLWVTGGAHVDELAKRFAALTLPADLAGEPGAGPIAVRDFVARMRRRVPDPVRRARAAALAPPRAAPTVQVVGRMTTANAWPIRFRSGRPEALADSMLLLVDARNAPLRTGSTVASMREPAVGLVQCHDLADLRQKWPAELALPRDSIIDRQTQEDRALVFRLQMPGFTATIAAGVNATRPAYGLADGQTLLVTSSRGVHAVGLTSGLRLWARGLSPGHSFVAGSDQPIALTDRAGPLSGRLAMIVDAHDIEMVSTLTGQPIWRRTIAEAELAAVRVKSDHVVVASRTFERAWVFSAADGTFLSSVRFKTASAAPRPAAAAGRRTAVRPARPTSLAVFDNVICGPNGKGVIAYDLQTGREVWRRATAHAVSALFKPEPGLLGIGTTGGELLVLAPHDGSEKLATVLPKFGGAIVDAVMHDATLVVLGQAPATAATSGKGPTRLMGLRMSDAGVQWGPADAPGPVDPSQLRAAENAIPVLEMLAGPGRQLRALRVVMIDKATGRRIGRGVQLPAALDITQESAVEVSAGHVVIGGRRGVIVFKTSGPSARGAGGLPRGVL